MGFNFIDTFLEYTKEVESPTSFLTWSAITTLAAVMKDNIVFDTGHDKIYPNIYVLLVARSGACRKGTPLKIAQSLIALPNTVRVIAGRATIQAVIKELASTTTTAGGNIISGANGILYTEELSAFFHEGNDTITILTDLYDAHDVWTDRTISSGQRELKDVCLSMFGASNEILLRDVFTSPALYGGLLARTFVIMESNRRHKNSRMRMNLTNTTALKDELRLHLVRLASLKGKVKFSDQAIDEYEHWYDSIDDEKYASKSGVEARMHTSVLKLAMCLASSEEEFFRDKVVQKAHVSRAIDMTLALLPNYEVLTMGSGRSAIAEPMGLIVKCLLKAKNNELSRKSLLRNNFGDLDVEILDKSITTMTQKGACIEISVGGEVGYRLTPDFIAEITKANGRSSNAGAKRVVN